MADYFTSFSVEIEADRLDSWPPFNSYIPDQLGLTSVAPGGRGRHPKRTTLPVIISSRSRLLSRQTAMPSPLPLYRQFFTSSSLFVLSVLCYRVLAATQQMDAMAATASASADLTNALENALTIAGSPSTAKSSMLTMRGEALTSPANNAVGLHTTSLKTSSSHNVHNRINRNQQVRSSEENVVPFTQQQEPLPRNNRISANAARQTRSVVSDQPPSAHLKSSTTNVSVVASATPTTNPSDQQSSPARSIMSIAVNTPDNSTSNYTALLQQQDQLQPVGVAVISAHTQENITPISAASVGAAVAAGLPAGFISPFEAMMMNYSSPSSLSAQLRALPTAGGGDIITAMTPQQISTNDIPAASRHQPVFDLNHFSSTSAQEAKAKRRHRLQQQHQQQLHLQQQNGQLTNFQTTSGGGGGGGNTAQPQQHHQPDYTYINDGAAQLSIDVKTGRLGRGGGNSGAGGYSSSSNSASANNPASPASSSSPQLGGGGGGGGGNSNVGNGIQGGGGGSGMSIGGPVSNIPRMSASAAYSSARNKLSDKSSSRVSAAGHMGGGGAATPDTCETYSFVVRPSAFQREDVCLDAQQQMDELVDTINKLKAQSQVDREMRHRLELQVLHEVGENQKLKSDILASRTELEKIKNQILQLEVLIWREKFIFENETGGKLRGLEEKFVNMTDTVTKQLGVMQDYVHGRVPVASADGTTTCHFEKTPNAGILHYNDKQLRVTNVMDCLKACVSETMFNCRSVDFLRTGTNQQNTGECLLSKDNHFTVPEENFNSYVGWDYYIKVCK